VLENRELPAEGEEGIVTHVAAGTRASDGEYVNGTSPFWRVTTRYRAGTLVV